MASINKYADPWEYFKLIVNKMEMARATRNTPLLLENAKKLIDAKERTLKVTRNLISVASEYVYTYICTAYKYLAFLSNNITSEQKRVYTEEAFNNAEEALDNERFWPHDISKYTYSNIAELAIELRNFQKLIDVIEPCQLMPESVIYFWGTFLGNCSKLMPISDAEKNSIEQLFECFIRQFTNDDNTLKYIYMFEMNYADITGDMYLAYNAGKNAMRYVPDNSINDLNIVIGYIKILLSSQINKATESINLIEGYINSDIPNAQKADLYAWLGRAYFTLNQLDDAEKAYQEAIALYPCNHTYYRYAFFLSKSGNYEKSNFYLSKITIKTTDEVNEFKRDCARISGTNYLALGEYQKAIENFQISIDEIIGLINKIDLTGQSSVGYFHHYLNEDLLRMIQALIHAGEYEKAKEQLKAAEHYFPNALEFSALKTACELLSKNTSEHDDLEESFSREYAYLSQAALKSLISAERIYRLLWENQSSFSDGLIIDYAKVVEIQLRKHLHEKRPDIDIDYKGMGDIIHLIAAEKLSPWQRYVSDYKIINKFRNEAAHRSAATADAIKTIRHLLFDQKLLATLR